MMSETASGTNTSPSNLPFSLRMRTLKRVSLRPPRNASAAISLIVALASALAASISGRSVPSMSITKSVRLVEVHKEDWHRHLPLPDCSPTDVSAGSFCQKRTENGIRSDIAGRWSASRALQLTDQSLAA